MATIETEYAGGKARYRVSFKTPEGRRRRLRLRAGTTKRDANNFARWVGELESARGNNGSLAPSVLEWLGGLPLELRQKLRDAELLPGHVAGSIERLTIDQWFRRYLEERPDFKPATREQIEITGRNLTRFFGGGRALDRVTAAEAKRWRSWMLTAGREGRRRSEKASKATGRGRGRATKKPEPDREQRNTKLSEDTVRRRTGRAKQVFGEAVERGLIVTNPFAKLPSASRVNTVRQRFVDVPTITAVLEQAPSIEWRTIIALARFGGLRIPSELSTLRWDRVNLPEGRMTVQATKTEHHRDGGLRVVPIFTELRPFLEAAWDAATPGAVYVIETPKRRRKGGNLGTELCRMIERAGVERWPKVFQNLRASRETELLAAGYPAKDVASWLGNSVPIAMKHYAMATAEQFQRAIEAGATPAGRAAAAVPAAIEGDPEGETDAEGGGTGGGNNAPHPATTAISDPGENDESPQIAGFCGSVPTGGDTLSCPTRTRT